MKLRLSQDRAYSLIIFHKSNPIAIVNFDNSNGELVNAGLIEASDGNFYGTNRAGGANDAGKVFRLTPEGLLTTLSRSKQT